MDWNNKVPVDKVAHLQFISSKNIANNGFLWVSLSHGGRSSWLKIKLAEVLADKIPVDPPNAHREIAPKYETSDSTCSAGWINSIYDFLIEFIASMFDIDINELIGNSNFFPISSSFGGKIYGFAISIGFNEISFNDLEIFKIGLLF